jgi:hypothetical protein
VIGLEVVVVGILRVPPTDTAMAGMVLVAPMMERRLVLVQGRPMVLGLPVLVRYEVCGMDWVV